MQRDQRRLALQTFAVRRVAQHRAALLARQRIFQLQHILTREGKEIGDAGAPCVSLRPFQHAPVAVVAEEARLRGGGASARALLRLAFHLAPQRVVMLTPVGEAPAAAQQAWRAIAGDQRCLDQQRAGAAHRIEQRRGWLPAGAQHDRRRQVLLERRLAGLLTIAALMQRVAAQIQRDAGAIFIQPDVDADIRLLAIHIGTRQFLAGKGVDNCVLDL